MMHAITQTTGSFLNALRPRICLVPVIIFIAGCGHVAHTVHATDAAAEPDQAEVGITVPAPVSEAEPGRFPFVEIANVYLPEGESNVRSSFKLHDGVGLFGTEETGDIYKTEDAGMTWRKVWDGGDRWGIMDVRNYIRAQDGHLYITTTEPATVAKSTDEGESWHLVAAATSSRTVGLVQLDDGAILVGLRRAFKKRISILRTEDHFETVDKWIPLSDTDPPQNVTCFGYWGGTPVLAGIGYEGSGKIFISTDSGLTWTKKAEIEEARDLMDFFKSGENIFVLVSGVASLYKSTDGGETWNKAKQFWEKGFLGQCIPYERDGKTYWLIAATDQRVKPYRHVVLISDDGGDSWYEWIELVEDTSGGASNISIFSDDTVIVGTGNHSAQGRAFTLKVHE